MDFNKWKEESLSKGELKTWIEWCELAFKAGQQSKQDKIDEALAEISRAMKCCESIETECVLTEIKELLK